MAEAVAPTPPNPVLNLMSGGSPIPDNLGGATINVTGGAGDLQAAIDGTGAFAGQGAIDVSGNHKGNTYVCPAGAVYNPLMLPAAGTGYTCIRSNGTLPAGTRVSPADVGQMFRINGPANVGEYTVLIPDGSDGWRIIGMHAFAQYLNGVHFTILKMLGRRISIERCVINADATNADVHCATWCESSDFQMWDSYSEARSNDFEAKGIFMRTHTGLSNWETRGRFHLENTEFRATGENVFVSDQAGTAVPSVDVTVRRCFLYKPSSWRPFIVGSTTVPNPDFVPVPPHSYGQNVWSVKNSYELKSCIRSLFEGNTIDGSWQGLQNGEAFVINQNTNDGGDGSGTPMRVEDAAFHNNDIRNCDNGVLVNDQSIPGTNPFTPTRISIKNNRFLGCQGFLVWHNHKSQDVRVEHNTCVPSPGWVGSGFQPAFYGASAEPWGSFDAHVNLTWKSNVTGWNYTGILWLRDAGGGTGLGVFTDTIANFGLPSRFWVANALCNHDPAQPAVTGLEFFDTFAAAGVDTTTGVLASNSPLKVGQPGYFGPDGKDIGVDFAALEAALGNTTTAPVASFTYSQLPGTRTIQFQDTSA